MDFFLMEKNGCSFRKTPRDSLETSVKVFKHQNKTPIANRQYHSSVICVVQNMTWRFQTCLFFLLLLYIDSGKLFPCQSFMSPAPFFLDKIFLLNSVSIIFTSLPLL